MNEDIRNAIEAARTIGRQFASFGVIAETADALLALVNHEDELRTQIRQMQVELATLETSVSTARAAEEQRTREAKATGDATIAEYTNKIGAIDAELRAAKEHRNAALQATQFEADRGVRAITEELNRVKATIAAERTRLLADHEAFIDETKSHRARIEQNTKVLEDKLDALRAQARGALAAVEDEQE